MAMADFTFFHISGNSSYETKEFGAQFSACSQESSKSMKTNSNGKDACRMK